MSAKNKAAKITSAAKSDMTTGLVLKSDVKAKSFSKKTARGFIKEVKGLVKKIEEAALKGRTAEEAAEGVLVNFCLHTFNFQRTEPKLKKAASENQADQVYAKAAKAERKAIKKLDAAREVMSKIEKAVAKAESKVVKAHNKVSSTLSSSNTLN